VTVKFAVDAPAATVTLAGTVAAAVMLLDRDTTAPPAAAGPLSVTVPVEAVPPATVVGERVTDWRTAGVTVTLAGCEPAPYTPVMVAVVEEVSARVVTAYVAVVAPAATVTLAGAVATAVLLLERVTAAPPVGAGPFKVTVPVAAVPPTTLAGAMEFDCKATGTTVRVVVTEIPL
jgi:hypothetical protein